MTDKAELSLLLDYYGGFLTERKRELMRYCADEDMSLSEIAELAGVSRQSVRDSISKGTAELMGYEQQLGVIQKDRALSAVAEALSTALSQQDEQALRAGVEAAAERLRRLIG